MSYLLCSQSFRQVHPVSARVMQVGIIWKDRHVILKKPRNLRILFDENGVYFLFADPVSLAIL